MRTLLESQSGARNCLRILGSLLMREQPENAFSENYLHGHFHSHSHNHNKLDLLRRSKSSRLRNTRLVPRRLAPEPRSDVCRRGSLNLSWIRLLWLFLWTQHVSMIKIPTVSRKARRLFPSLLDLGCGRNARHALDSQRLALGAPLLPLPCLLEYKLVLRNSLSEPSGEVYGIFSVQCDFERVFSPQGL